MAFDFLKRKKTGDDLLSDGSALDDFGGPGLPKEEAGSEGLPPLPAPASPGQSEPNFSVGRDLSVRKIEPLPQQQTAQPKQSASDYVLDTKVDAMRAKLEVIDHKLDLILSKLERMY